MYVRITTFKIGPGKREEAIEVAKQIDPVIRSQKGASQLSFFGDNATGEYGGMVFWDTKEDSEAGFSVIFPQVQQLLQGKVQEPPKTGLYEVIDL